MAQHGLETRRRRRFPALGGRALTGTTAGIALLALLAPLFVFTPAAADEGDPDEPVLIQFEKTAIPAAPAAATPGGTVTYQFTINCSSLETDCLDLRLSDTVPEPLVLQSVTTAVSLPPIAVETDGNDFTVDVIDDLGGGFTGMQAGTGIQINATATVPADLSSDFDGVTLTNTATVSVSNRADLTLDPPRPNQVPSSADVVLAVTRTLGTDTTKTVTPDAMPATLGRAVAFELGATNSSNGSVDELVIQEPADTSSTIFDFVRVVDLDALIFPAGADRVRVDWFDGSDWVVGATEATASLPTGVDTADIRGVRIVFSASSGRIDRGATGGITVRAELTAAAAAVDSSVTLTNTISSWVRYAGDSSSPELAADTLRLDPSSVAPVATKEFERAYVIGGQRERVTIGGQNGGDFPLRELTITEPAPGTMSLAEQGLVFDGWADADIEWPVGATSAEVSYWYTGDTDYAAAETVTTADTLPGPLDAAEVQSIRVRFLSSLPGGMTPGQYASLPFFVVADPVVADVTSTNEVRVDVVALDDQTAAATAADELTRRTARVNTEVGKSITPSEIYSIAGASTLVSLPARITPLPAATVDPTASTVGSTMLRITDPVGEGLDDFYDYFDATDIVATGVPASTVLTIEYFDGEQWNALPGATDVAGPTILTASIDPGIRDDVQGLRFTYRHSTYDAVGTLLNPGFNVQPNIRFALRAEQRDGAGEAASATRLETLTLENSVESAVANPTATPPEATDTAAAEIDLLPTNDGSGDGSGNVVAVSKEWQTVPSTGIEAVVARSAEQATARILWGTAGIGFASVVVSDTASDPATTPVAQTVFDAFDLVRVPEITAGMDPLLTYDRVAAVELFLPGTGWVGASADPCPASCDGAFPGYTLSASERANATGVRLILDESPTRSARTGSDPLAPTVGSGVAASMTLERRLDLIFAVRDQRRSDPTTPVLGTSREALYNTGVNGEVLNTVRFDGRDADDTVRLTREAADTIQIIDQPLNVDVTKTWVDGPLGTPPDGTPQELFPRARMTIVAENASLQRVDELSILDPVGGTDPFEAVNLVDIVTLTVPTGAADTEIVLSRESGSPTTHTRTEALGLSASELADVTGIAVIHTGRIAVGQTARLVIDTQLRHDLRSLPGTRVTAANSSTVLNTAQAIVRDPGGLADPPGDETTNTLVAEADAQIAVQNLSYGVTATKSIQADTLATAVVPATQFDGNARTASITLTGQPSGNVRSTDMIIEDIRPSFWNAYNLSALGSHSFAAPLNRVKVDVLVGVDYVLGGADGIDVTCSGSSVLDDCWVEGTFGSTLALPTLPDGVTTADIRGVRFHYTRADGATWERPFNPLQTVRFTVARRDLLVAPSTEPVPSTLYIYDSPAPGEDETGVFTNTVTVTSWADNSPNAPLWQASDDDERALLFQHRPAEVRVVKTPFGPLTLGAPIPYEIEITNTGTGADKDLRDLEIIDLIPLDSTGPMLVLGTDPETGGTAAAADVISLELTNTLGQPLAPPTFTAELDSVGAEGQPLRIEIDDDFILPKGWTLTIQAPLFFRQFLEAGTADDKFALNSAIVSSDQEFDRCEYATDGEITDPVQERVATCTSTTRVWALPSAPMNIVKGVKGVGAGPLDSNGTPLIDPLTDAPYDDLGVIRTVNNGVDCGTPTLDVAGTDYYRYPCVPITRPGGTEEWVGNFFNAGNVRVFEIAAIDVLPRENDRGVIINDARSSRWTPTLLERPRLVGWPEAALTVLYTDRLDMATPACNGADIQAELGMSPSSDPPMVQSYWPCVSSSSPGGLLDRADPSTGWQVMPDAPSAALLESVVAMKFVVDLTVGVSEAEQGLLPGEEVSIVYSSRTANEPVLRESDVNLARDSIAYNSIAGAARGRDGDNDLPYRFVTEPRKVGVALATGAIEVEKVVDGAAAAFAPADFDIEVQCTVDGEPISLLSSSGANRSPFTILGGASPTRILGIPLYAECAVSEVGPTGATTETILPQTLTVRALDYSPSTVFSPRPVFTEREPLERSTVTNTYELASLTVSKTVNMNGARNASGDPVMQTDFRFSVACSFTTSSGTQSVPVAPATFALNDGQSRTFTGLPAGAVCTVTETTTRGATVTKVITTNGTATEPTAASAVVTLSPDTLDGTPTNLVAYTNSIAVGSLTVTKSITGAAAAAPYDYGNGTFSVLVSCTRAASTIAPATQPAGAPATAVWYGTLTFSAATQLSQTITNIPAGSSCTLTEPVTGGATAVTIQSPNPVTTTSGSVTRTVTNRFDLASLTVGKTVQTAAVDQSGAPVYPEDPFAFSVACAFQGATVTADGFPASPMTFTLRHDETRTLTGLPAGATCSVSETDAQEADSTSIARTVATTTTAVAGATTTISALAADGAGATTRNSVIFTNRYGVTSLTVSKAALGGAAAQFAPESVTATVICTSPLVGESFNGDVIVPVGGFVTIDNLADGSTCAVSERDPLATGADAHRIVDADGAVIDGTGLVVTAAEPVAVTLENYYLTGELVVTKSVVGAGAAFGEGPFAVTLSCERGGVAVEIDGGATREITPDGVVRYALLPSGAECTLVESAAAGATSSVIRDAAGTELTDDVSEGWSFTVEVDAEQLVDDQAQPSLEVENTFALAGLSVTKTVTSDAVDHLGDPVSYGPFPVSVACTFEGAEVYATGYDAQVPMQRDVVAGETWSLGGLPHGAECAIDETDPMDAATTSILTAVEGSGTTSWAGSAATVTLGTDTVATIDNAYTVGSLLVSKLVTGEGVDAWADQPFTIDVTCVLDDASGERTVFSDSMMLLRGDDPVLIDDIASGSVCTITETATGGASSTRIEIDGASTDGLTESVLIGDALVEVDVINEFAVGEVQVAKVRDGLGAELWGAGPFEVELSCTRTVDGVALPIEIPGGSTRLLTDDGLYRATFDALPHDADCTLVETRTAGATTTSIDLSGVTVGAEPAEFVVTNTFDVGSVAVEKSFLGDGTGLYVRGTFEATLACTLVVDGLVTELEIPGGPTRELSEFDGYRAVWHEIPAGAECTVEESRTGGATSVTIEDGTFTVAPNTEHVVSITNAFLLAAFAITKDVTGPMASSAMDSTFVVETSCLWPRDGEMMPVLSAESDDPWLAASGTPVLVEVQHGSTVTFTDLPAGAECTVIEVDDGGASAQLLWVDGAVQPAAVALAAGMTDSTLSNVFLPTLPVTGFELAAALWLVLALVFGGVVLVAVARTQRTMREQWAPSQGS